ncbi:translocation/assembly module TamB domain-containing protein [Luteimonas vadosa]|uniref:Translocation/assembly module TamB domain-containing protein n=1 Tax=Luteimonas vadosa TaxID=1165507 RepID=A0ABP9DQD9_9GAMM
MAGPANTRRDDLSPEEREARIAELRTRRRARMRKLAIRSALGTGVLVALLAVFAYWALTTVGGRGFLLSQIVQRLPAGTELTWREAEGPAAGPLVLRGVRFVMRSCPDAGGEPVPFGQCAEPGVLTFTARRVMLDPDIRPLFGMLLRLDALEIEGAVLDLPRTDEPFELPRWPDVLPRIEPPLGLQADSIRIDGFRVARGGEAVVDIRSARGGIDARSGKLHVERLVVDSDRGLFRVHGDYAPRDDYATELSASALLPAPPGRTRPRIGLAAIGNLDAMDVALDGHAPAPLRARLTLRGRDRPRWTLRADSTALDPALLAGTGEPGTPLAVNLRATGVGGDARLRGRLARGDLVAVLQPSRLRIEEQVLELRPLVVDAFGGRIEARGRGNFAEPDNADFRFAVRARDLVFGGAPGTDGGAEPAPAIGADARFGIAGTTRAWAAIGQATLTRDDQQATIAFDGRGDAEAMRLRKARVAMPTGTLDATGQVGWTPALGWDLEARLAGFDPGYFASGWNGAVNGRLASTGRTRDDGGLDVQVDARQLGGQLRGRKLDGQASLAIHGPATGGTRTDYAGEIALTLGGSRIDARGTVAQALDVDARLTPLQLADLLPGAAGTLRGTLSLTGTRDAPNVVVDLEGSGLQYGDTTAANLDARGRLPWRGGGGALAIRAQGVQAGVALDTLRIDATGAVEDLRLEAAARGDIGALDLDGTLARDRRGQWNGTLAAFQLDAAKGATWRLQSPARFAQAGSGFTLSESCFTSGGGGSLCASADWPRRGLTVDGNALPLSLVEPYLPRREDGRRWRLSGDVTLDARIRPAGNAYQGSARIASSAGGLRVGDRARRDMLSYRGLVLDADFGPQRIDATLDGGFNGDGRLQARVQTGWDTYAPLTGDVAIDTDELTWMELFSPDILDPKGQLDARITLGGTRAEPTIGGQARLSEFTTEIPSLGLVLQRGQVRMDALPDGTARIEGSVHSGEGVLHVDGTLGWRTDAATGAAAPLVLNVRGDNVLVSDTRDLRAIASPDLVVRYGGDAPLSVTGTVEVPSAVLDLERLDQGVPASPDVVVLDPVDPEDTGIATPLALDLTLVMGDDVQLRGFGLDGTLGGQMRVRSQPGREMTAQGVLEVGGTYTAYGQELAITRGRLQWSNGRVADPILDIRAEREIESRDVTAGIDVSGRASAPRAEVWSSPPTSQSDALAYLTLGRPTSSLTGAEGQQINAASAALNAGGNLLAARLGTRLGLDAAGISDSRALGGSVLGIGKQLSPRLYVGFGVSLLGTGQVVTLKYLLSRGFDIEIESSTLENRGSINWRKEK